MKHEPSNNVALHTLPFSKYNQVQSKNVK